MLILSFIVFIGVLWLHYEVTDPNGRLYDMFH